MGREGYNRKKLNSLTMAMEGKSGAEAIPEIGQENAPGSNRSFEVELPRDEQKERLMDMAPSRPEAAPVPESMPKAEAKKEAPPKADLRESIFLRELSESMDEKDREMLGAHFNSLPPQQQIEQTLNRRSGNAEQSRHKVLTRSLLAGALSGAGGVGFMAAAGPLGLDALLGVSVSTVLTGGLVGMGALAGLGIAIPPLMYAGHKFAEWRRDRRYKKLYGKPAPERMERRIWPFT
jgi:hypothetical protein